MGVLLVFWLQHTFIYMRGTRLGSPSHFLLEDRPLPLRRPGSPAV